MHKYMIHSPATVFLIVRKYQQHTAVVDINLKSWGGHSMQGKGPRMVQRWKMTHGSITQMTWARTLTLTTLGTRIFVRRFSKLLPQSSEMNSSIVFFCLFNFLCKLCKFERKLYQASVSINYKLKRKSQQKPLSTTISS